MFGFVSGSGRGATSESDGVRAWWVDSCDEGRINPILGALCARARARAGDVGVFSRACLGTGGGCVRGWVDLVGLADTELALVNLQPTPEVLTSRAAGFGVFDHERHGGSSVHNRTRGCEWDRGAHQGRFWDGLRGPGYQGPAFSSACRLCHGVACAAVVQSGLSGRVLMETRPRIVSAGGSRMSGASSVHAALPYSSYLIYQRPFSLCTYLCLLVVKIKKNTKVNEK